MDAILIEGTECTERICGKDGRTKCDEGTHLRDFYFGVAERTCWTGHMHRICGRI